MKTDTITIAGQPCICLTGSLKDTQTAVMKLFRQGYEILPLSGKYNNSGRNTVTVRPSPYSWEERTREVLR